MEGKVALYAKWLDSEIARVAAYHGHKEKMAWVATALVLGGAAGLTFADPNRIVLPGYRLPATIAALLGGYAVFVFIRMQFARRWHAANASCGLIRTKSKLLASAIDSEDFPSQLNETLQYTVDGAEKIPHYAKFIHEQIESCRARERRDAKSVRRAIGYVLTLRLSKVDPRWQTELPSYLAIALALLLVIGRTWDWPHISLLGVGVNHGRQEVLMSVLSLALTYLGYALAIIGTALLYFGTPKETVQGVIPVGTGDDVMAAQDLQEAKIGQRNRYAKSGFGFLLLGMLVQLSGVISAAL